ncbi:carboxymuconolactone decarboxylase family protein [bacterium BMS3Abin02]|nr:carboxymuconolactone decarboxylase family protein [bacterium BMS3Abin02]GBE21283.1 carboxymuconolactone decarboxylase family protein [bacterium BMS3Bbin01]
MTRVPLQDPATATGRTKEVFDRVAGYYGMVPTLQQAMAPLPEVTNALWDLSTMTMKEGTIPGELRRAIFVVTATAGECDYCTAAHMLALFRHGWSVEECVEIVEGRPSSRLGELENAVLEFARVVAARPAAVTDEMTDRLGELGWTDAQIVEMVTTVALLKYTSTVATALDIPFEKIMLPLLDGPPFRSEDDRPS